jgi:hypothetical protein
MKTKLFTRKQKVFIRQKKEFLRAGLIYKQLADVLKTKTEPKQS